MRYIIIVLLLCIGVSASAQEIYNSSGKTDAQVKRETERKKKAQRGKFDPSRLVLGGGFIFGLADGVTDLGISPIVGYRFTDKFVAGVGVSYEYIRIKNAYLLTDPITNLEVTKPLNAHIYAPNVWARHMIWNNIFAHVEYQHNFVSMNRFRNEYDWAQNAYVIKETRLNFNQPSLWLGAGIRQPVSEKVSIVAMGLYNVLEDKHNLFAGRIAFRFGINAGF